MQPLLDRFDRLGVVSKSWMIILLATFIVPNVIGAGGLALNLMAFNPGAILDLQLWRLFTYPLVEGGALNLLFSLILIYLFGSHYESQMGSKKFFVYAVVIHVFAGLLCTGFDWIIPESNVSSYVGTSIFIDALLLQIFLTDRNSNILLGFLLPVNVSVVIILFLFLEVLRAVGGEGNHLYLMVSALFVAWAYHVWNTRGNGPRRKDKKPKLRIYN